MNLILRNIQYIRTQHHEETGLQNSSHLKAKAVSVPIDVKIQHTS